MNFFILKEENSILGKKMKELELSSESYEKRVIDREKEILRLKSRLESRGLDLEQIGKEGSKQEYDFF